MEAVTGATPRTFTDYSPDWYLHNAEPRLLEGIAGENRGKLERVRDGTLMDGDIMLFRFGKAISHFGIYCDGRIYTALDRIGVKKLPAKDRELSNRTKHVFRLMQ